MPAILPFFIGTHGGSGTVTSINATTPNSVLTITGGPITNAGVFVFTLNAAIESVGTIPSSGIVAFDSAGPDFIPVALSGTANQITVVNPTGVGGNPTFSLNPLMVLGTPGVQAALTLSSGVNGLTTIVTASGLTTTTGFGLPGTNGTTGQFLAAIGGGFTQWDTIDLAGRTITGTTNQIVVTDGDGVSGNPTISLPTNVVIGGRLTCGSVLIGNTALASITASGDAYTFTYPPTVGTANYVLLNTGSGTTGWANPNAYQSYQWWTTTSPTGTNSVIITFPSGPFAYDIIFKNIFCASDDQMFVAFSNDGGSTFPSGTIQGANFGYWNGTTPATSGATNGNVAIICGFTAFFSVNFGFSGKMTIWPGGSRSDFNTDTNFVTNASTGLAAKNVTNGSVGLGGVNAVKFTTSSNITSGDFVVFLYNEQ